MMKRNLNIYVFVAGLILFTCASCKKLISIPEPVDTITTNKVFANDTEANSAMAGVFSVLINDLSGNSIGQSGFATGLTMMVGSLSSDDFSLEALATSANYAYSANRLLAKNVYDLPVWTTAYQAIYGSNAVIEGIEASNSPKLSTNARTKLTAEAKFVRAFSYFYLVNFFGDIPLTLTVDFNKTVKMPRTPASEVYAQIIKDLQDAKSVLAADFSGANGNQRIRPNKWAAAALLARVYLYTGDYANAAAQANEVISQSQLFQLNTDLNQVYLMNNTEAIWQLQQGNLSFPRGNATPEGYTFSLRQSGTAPNIEYSGYQISDQLEQTFEMGDQRKQDWLFPAVKGGKTVYYINRYKVGLNNSAIGGTITEYATVMRLAEQYLIRAEAGVLGSNQLGSAISDLNVIRHRSGLDDLPLTLSRTQVLDAIAKERRTEFFAEWAHRWFDLKRTGKAHDVLSVMPGKQPWAGDYQLLYPIPPDEITKNNKLIQNPGY
jgi:hypothetical protein